MRVEAVHRERVSSGACSGQQGECAGAQVCGVLTACHCTASTLTVTEQRTTSIDGRLLYSTIRSPQFMRFSSILHRTAIQIQHPRSSLPALCTRTHYRPRPRVPLSTTTLAALRTMSSQSQSQSDLKTLEVLDASELKDGQQ